MASSTLSLGSLSSPSPSPSPPPQSDLNKGASSTHTSSASTAPPFRNIDTDDSELSELTDDDQDASAAADKRSGPAAGTDDDAVLHDDDAPAGSPSRAGKRGKSHRSSSSRRGVGGRKKRSSIVPAPMWGWVPERPPTALEEEEEEVTEPPRAMEEEEEEEDEEEDEEEEEEEEEEEDDYKNGDNDAGHVPQRRPQNPKRVSATHRSRAGTSKTASATLKRLAEEEEEEEDSSSYQSSKKKRPARSRVPAVSGPKRRKDNDDAASDEELPPNRKKGAKPSLDDQEADGVDEHEGVNGDDNTDSETEPSKPPAAPLSPAKLTSGNNPAGPASALSALAAVADGINPSTGPNGPPASTASSSVIAALSLEQLSNHIPRRSRSDSANSAQSSHDAGSSKAKPKPSKINSKVNKGNPRGKPSPTDKKDMTLQVNGTTSNGDSTKPATQAPAPSKKAPPPPLDLKIDTLVPNAIVTTNGPDMDVDGEEEVTTDIAAEDGMDVDMDPTSREPEEEEEEEEEEEVGDEGDEVSAREEEDVDPIDEEAEAGDVGDDADEDPLDGDEDPVDNDGEDEQDQEQDPEGVDAEQENEEGDHEEEVDEDVSPGGDADVEDHEGDMQPAHRAEALDVLATIELRFALLRERVYVEKMESLAWEESMIQNGVHPEMIHLQKELSKRRDKRLELASRKRSYEVANATTRRKADEAGLWSWWKAAKTTLQTDMISETSRKRRKLERERRASERPPPIRRIPQPFEIQFPPVPPLSLRKIVDKAYPFALKPKKDGRHRHPRPPKNLVYPEINTLSTPDVQADLEYLFHQRQQAEQQHQQRAQHQQSHYPQHPPLPRNGSGIGRTVGMGLPNGNMSSTMQGVQPSSMGPPPPGPRMQMNPGQPAAQHNLGMGYEPYPDGPSWPSANRIRDPYQSQGASMGVPIMRDNASAFSNYAAINERAAQAAHGSQTPMNSMQNGHGYPEHEMSTMGPSAPNTTGVGHQILPHHPYFGQGSVGPASNGAPPPGPHMPGHHERSGHKGSNVANMNGRRSMSPVHSMPNGGPKQPGAWMGSGMGMSNFHAQGNVNGNKAGEWDPRMPHEEDEQERLRERDRKRDEREREDRERARRDREYQDMERDRQRDHQHIQQQHRAPPPPPPGSGSHAGPHTHERIVNGPPAQGPGVGPHHPHPHHHHHRTHHHHVVHNHHSSGPQHASSSLPTTGGGAPPIIHSPRSTRDYDARPPPGPGHVGPGQTHPSDVIMLPSGSKPIQGQRDRDAGAWPMKGIDDKHHHHPPGPDYREREREMNKDRPENRDARKTHSGRQSVGPAMPSLDDRADRPLAMPFVMASSHAMQQSAAGSMANSTHPTSSPRGAWSGSSGAPMDGPSYRPGSSSVAPHDGHARSPVQGHRYASNTAAPLSRLPNSSSSGLPHRMVTPPLPSGRARPPPSPSYSNNVPSTQLQHSPPSSPKMRPLSPTPISATKHIYGPSSGPGFNSSPHLTGPGRTSTPTGPLPPPNSAGHPSSSNGNAPPYSMAARTASPLMASLQGGRPTNGNGADRDRHPLSPRLPASALPVPPLPPKLSAAQMVDGH